MVDCDGPDGGLAPIMNIIFIHWVGCYHEVKIITTLFISIRSTPNF